MEPQIGIRGRVASRMEFYDSQDIVSMEPQIGIRGRALRLREWRRENQSFNGAPDRNPGKGAPDNSTFGPGILVSMEPQIGIRGRFRTVANGPSTQDSVSMEPQIGIRGRP